MMKMGKGSDMPSTKKMMGAGASRPKQAVSMQGRKALGGAPSYPKTPGGSDGQFEHTAAGQTKLKKF